MDWKEMWALYYKRLIGIAAGILFGIIYLVFGFWDMCFVLILVLAGYWIGKMNEEVQERYSLPLFLTAIIDFVRKLFRPYR